MIKSIPRESYVQVGRIMRNGSSSIVLRFLKEETRLFEIIPDMEFGDYQSKSTLIKGAIQSGKTNIICSICLYLHSIARRNSILIVRNFNEDAYQFQRGMERFLERYMTYLKLHGGYTEENIENMIPFMFYAGNIIRKHTNQYEHITPFLEHFKHNKLQCVALANHDQLSKINHCLDTLHKYDSMNSFALIVDEVDQLLYTNGESLKIQMDTLRESSKQLFGVSATLYEPVLHSEFDTLNTYIMTPPSDYRGIPDVLFEFIEAHRGRSYEDASLLSFLDRDHVPFSNHPFISMIKTERKIDEQERLLASLKRRYPVKYTILTYNGDNIMIYHHSLSQLPLLVLSNKKKSIKEKEGDYHVFHKCPLSMVLQYLKDNGGVRRFERIIIIAHGLVGRGINIVSHDFEWHLTHMFYRPSINTSVESILQSMRLCGIYKDTIPLTCLLEKEYYDILYKGYQLQEDIFKRIKQVQQVQYGESMHDIGDKPLDHFMEKQKFYRDKIPIRLKRRFEPYSTDERMEDIGMNMEEFDRFKCVVAPVLPENVQPSIPTMMNMGVLEQADYHRLTNDNNGMFKKWSQSDSSIARFLKHGLEPQRQYSKKEISSLCRDYKVNLTHMMKPYEPRKWTFGNMIQLDSERYFLAPHLIQAFIKYF